MPASTARDPQTDRAASVEREIASFSVGEVLSLGTTGTELTVKRIDRRVGCVITEVTTVGLGDAAKEMYLNQSILLAPIAKEGVWMGVDGPQGLNQFCLMIQGSNKFLGTVAALYS